MDNGLAGDGLDTGAQALDDEDYSVLDDPELDLVVYRRIGYALLWVGDYSTLAGQPTEARVRDVGLCLGFGIFFLPWAFAPIVARKGYSGLARVLTAVWSVAYLAGMCA